MAAEWQCFEGHWMLVVTDNEKASESFARHAEIFGKPVELNLNLRFTDDLDDMLLFDEIERVHKAPLN